MNRLLCVVGIVALSVAGLRAEDPFESVTAAPPASAGLYTGPFPCESNVECESRRRLLLWHYDGDGDGIVTGVDRFLPRLNLPLPLMKGLVEGLDVPPLPPPFGVSVFNTELRRKVTVTDVRLAFGNDTPQSAERVGVSESPFHASSQIARLDLWVLPFLNVYALVGHTRTTGDVLVTVSKFPFPRSDPIDILVPADLHGPTAGYGLTGGVGNKNWVFTLDLNQTWTRFTKLDNSLTALVITPRFGRIIDSRWFKGELHVGAMWQDTDQTVDLTLNHPALGPGLHVQVDQVERRKWNFVMGGLWALDERFQILVEGGTGGRTYINCGLTLRF